MTKGAKWKTLLVTLISCLLITAIFYPITIPVDETVDGVLLSSQDGTAELVQVKQSGTYHWKVFGSDDMVESLEAKDKNGTVPPLFIIYSEDKGKGYYSASTEDGQKNYIAAGSLSYRPFANRGELVIFTQSAAEGGKPTQCLVFPASDRNSALEILKKHAPEQYDSFANGAS